MLLDVIEHQDDDAGFLSTEAFARLRPGGLALVSAPAFQRLFGGHDKWLGHYRRYDLEGLKSVLTKAGFTPVGGGYIFLSPLLARVCAIIIERAIPAYALRARKGASGWPFGKTLASIIGAALYLECAAMAALAGMGLRLPGLTVWALCEKPR
jgi:hypothetical protein